jgi:hypothetical protein
VEGIICPQVGIGLTDVPKSWGGGDRPRPSPVSYGPVLQPLEKGAHIEPRKLCFLYGFLHLGAFANYVYKKRWVGSSGSPKILIFCQRL